MSPMLVSFSEWPKYVFGWVEDIVQIKPSGAPNDNFLSDPLKRYFRPSGVALKLYMFILGSAIIFLSVRSF